MTYGRVLTAIAAAGMLAFVAPSDATAQQPVPEE